MQIEPEFPRPSPGGAMPDQDEAIVIVALDGRLVEASPEAERIFQLPLARLRSLSFHDVTHPEDLLRDEAHFERMIAMGTGGYSLLKRYRRAHGDYIWCELDVALVTDPTGAGAHVVAHIRPANIRDATLNLLHDQVLHDPLTRLLNRATLLDQLDTALFRARRRDAPFALAILDLDGFKRINDDHGHEAGDRLLREVADRLRGTIHPPDLAGRLGGDEFAFLLRDAATPDALARRVSKITGAFDTPFHVSRIGDVMLGASIGLAVHPVNGTTASDLLRHADQSMYECKRLRRE